MSPRGYGKYVNWDMSSKKYLRTHLRNQAERDQQPPLVGRDPAHPGEECPCEDCRADRK